MIPLFLSNFYPRPPRGGRPVDPLMFTVVPLFLSTPSARRATCLLTLYGSKEGISIHALREEGDEVRRSSSTVILEFLSTPSARRATVTSSKNKRTNDISIHALREEGDHSSLPVATTPTDFYPRPPRGGRRFSNSGTNDEINKFLSTPSARRATCNTRTSLHRVTDFYPRPPRGGRRPPIGGLKIGAYFYPRPPRGGRPSVRIGARGWS